MSPRSRCLAAPFLVVALLAIALAVVAAPAPAGAADSAKPALYLTFDDGPNARFTPQILDLLDKYQAKATFFVVGVEVRRNPDLFDRIVRSGHAVGNHTWLHQSLPKLTDAAIRQTVGATSAEAALHGTGLQCVRPPYGAHNARVDAVLRSEGYAVTMWDIDTLDWKDQSTDRIVRSVSGRVLANKVVLMHDGGGSRNATVAATARLLAELADKYELKAMPECGSTPAVPVAPVPAPPVEPAAAQRVDAPAVIPVKDGPALRFAPTAPRRIVDTRAGNALQAGEVRRFATSHGGAGALATNITVTKSAGEGYLAAWNCEGPRPETSVSNFGKGATRATGTIVPLNANGDFCLFASVGADVIVDEAGEYSSAGAGLVSGAPARLVDTRSGPTPVGPNGRLAVVTPPGAIAVTVNLTVTDPTKDGYLTAYPCSESAAPTASNVNFVAGETVANLATVRVDSSGLCISASVNTHLIVDLLGWYSATGGDSYQPVVPIRLLDTRSGVGGWNGRSSADQTIELAVGASASGHAVMTTLTAVDERGAGFVVAWPCDSLRPNASVLNFRTDKATPNAMIGSVGASGSECMMASERTHLIVDLLGMFVPA
jgi:peptidoglycan-N-acetylglucosamine deacetylase